MKKISLALASVVLSGAAAFGQAIAVPTFGPSNAQNTPSVQVNTGSTINTSWTVTAGTVDLNFFGQGSQSINSPDGNASVDLDGSSVGQIKTQINVPGIGLENLIFTSLDGPLGASGFGAGAVIGTVTATQIGNQTKISFWLSSNDQGNPVFPAVKTFSVTLGIVSFTNTIALENAPNSPEWTTGTDTFGASVTNPPSIPDNGGTAILFGATLAGLALVRRMTTAKA